MTGDDLRRALTRMAHEITERNHGFGGLILIGLQTGGVPLAQKLAVELARIEAAMSDAPPTGRVGAAGTTLDVGVLDVAFYRDDIALRPLTPQAVTEIPFDLTGRTVILVDDVLYTGRTIRAALEALTHYGRARAVQLAVMVDRGHRELPIRPDYVGKNLPTRPQEFVDVHDDGVDVGIKEQGLLP
ncbi:MAG: bifunctional pyr operon transcriptional regulator/uracil phosphoribosyltransferase PyrR [Acidimicrobiales bacterium]